MIKKNNDNYKYNKRAKNIGVVLRSGHYLNKMKSTKTVGIGNGKRSRNGK